MAVAYKSAGAGVATATSGASLQPACPATVDASDILVVHACYRNNTSTPSTPTGFTLLGGGPFLAPPPPDSPVVGRHWFFGKVAAGTEDGATVDLGSAAVTTVRHARVYSFSVDTAGAIADHIVNITSVGGPGGDSTVTDAGVTTVGTDSLAVNLVYIVNDHLGLAAFAGETGGNWTIAIAQFDTSLGLDGVQQIQTAAMPSPGTINGGSFSFGGEDAWGVIGFELKNAAGGTDGTATPAAIAVGVTMPQAGVDAAAGPSPVTAAGTLPAPTATGAGTASPSAIDTPVTLPSVALSAGVGVSPIATTASLPQADAGGSETATPAALEVAATLPAASATGDGAGSPAAIATAATLPSVQVSAGAGPSPVDAVAALPLATASGGGSGTAAPDPIAVAVAVLVVAVSAGAGPSAILADAALPAVAATGAAAAVPDPIAATASLPAALVSAGATVTPSVILLAALLPQATATGGGTAPEPNDAGTYREPTLRTYREAVVNAWREP